MQRGKQRPVNGDVRLEKSETQMENQLNIFLLIGQSNMAGRGRINEVPAILNPHVSMFREGRWITAEEPLHTDKPEIAGVGLGMSFAVELVDRLHLAPVGLVPCAVGGTPLSRWMPHADLYENAVSVAQQALFKGTLRGILWHQGEGDSGNADDANSYGGRFQQMINALRVQLMAQNVPVITGELGTFLEHRTDCTYFNMVNQQLRDLAGRLPAYDCASAKSLTDKGDSLHFNSESLREFGRRFANKYVDIVRRSEQEFKNEESRRDAGQGTSDRDSIGS